MFVRSRGDCRIAQGAVTMITLRPAAERGLTRIDWLDSRHSFSFGSYMDPRHMGFRALRVINDDRVAPGAGFPTHGHRDMEILTYVLDGALAHADSLGTGSTIARGDVQVMSAGTGIRHSEFNPAADKPVHFLQIWLLPAKQGLAPRYDQTRTRVLDAPGRLHLVAAPEGGVDGAVTVHQDVRLHAGLLRAGARIEHRLAAGRAAWLHVASGTVTIDGVELGDGDGAAIEDVARLAIVARADSEVLLFDLG
jgi:redox-sensitive bicupin YhaK (pirin superfamily)